MLCPTCKTVGLVMAECQGVEIDYCPECRGVWLDRGELDKIIEKSIQSEGSDMTPQFRHENDQPPSNWLRHGKTEHHDGHSQGANDYRQHGDRRSFWKDLFD